MTSVNISLSSKPDELPHIHNQCISISHFYYHENHNNYYIVTFIISIMATIIIIMEVSNRVATALLYLNLLSLSSIAYIVMMKILESVLWS